MKSAQMKSAQMKSAQMKSNRIKLAKKTMKLTLRDYKNILKFYKIDTQSLTSKVIKEKAEHFLAVKLCKCIKNLKGARADADEKRADADEKRAIAICYNSVLTKKRLKVFKFNCKKTVKLLPKKGTRKIFIEKLA